MFNWNSWVAPGLVTVAALILLSVLLHGGALQAGLADRTNDTLSARHPWAQTEIVGRDVTLRGEAPSQEAMDDAAAIVSQVGGVRQVIQQARLLPVASPYLFSATRSDDGIVLEGFAPNDQDRALIADAARIAIPGVTVDNRMTTARGAPVAFAELAGLALAQLAAMQDGSVKLVDNRFSISGLAQSAIAYESIIEALSADLPAGASLNAMDLRPPAVETFQFAVTREGSRVVIDGNVPDLETRNAILLEANSIFSGAEVKSSLVPATGAPKDVDWSAAVQFLMRQTSRLSQGSATLAGAEMSLVGLALSAADFSALEAALGRNLPVGVELTVADIVKPSK